MQPVSMLMSNLNVTNTTHHAPNAMAAAQDTGQSQEIVREGIRVVQTVQASEAASEAQRIHRKNENDERDEQKGQQKNSRDSFEHQQQKEKNKSPEQDSNTPLIREVKTKKKFEFYA